MQRRKSRQIKIGDVKIGANAPISVQSMCNTDTRDLKTTLSQIKKLENAGCEIVRLAVLNKEAAENLKNIKKKTNVPLVADIHFDYRLAIQALESGIDALRINPGNIGKEENIKKVVELARTNKIPIRIGVNGGSLDKDIKISLKSSDVMTMIEAYRNIAKLVDYPLHLGVTEAGTAKNGIIKSSIGWGTLLAEGIGDTIRVSLTENPVKEVEAGFDILKALNLRQIGVNFVSCPTCGRCQIDLISLEKKI